MTQCITFLVICCVIFDLQQILYSNIVYKENELILLSIYLQI